MILPNFNLGVVNFVNVNLVNVNFVNVNENLDWQAVHNRDVSDAGIALRQTLHLWKQPLLFEFLASYGRGSKKCTFDSLLCPKIGIVFLRGDGG